jgi:TRAP-type transport system periplasmic protein
MTEYIGHLRKPCQQEMRRFGIVYLGSGASDVVCPADHPTPVASPPTCRACACARAARRSGPLGRELRRRSRLHQVGDDQFEAMSQGVIDGTMASIADLVSFRLVELVKHVTFLPIGLYQSTSNFTTNADVWASLSVEDRDGLCPRREPRQRRLHPALGL